MDKFLIKDNKRKAPAASVQKRHPTIIISHNVNGFAGRLQNNLNEYKEFLITHNPDVLLLQEAKLQCAEGPRQGKVHDGIKRGSGKGSGNKAQIAKHTLLQQFFPPRSFGQDSKDPVFKQYNIKYSLSRDTRLKSYAGTICIYKKDVYIPMFRYWLDGPERHEEHGRIMVLEFPQFILLNTYCPNNKTTEQGWERRKQWDHTMQNFVTQHHEHGNKPLIWVGDMNTTTDDHDMDSPKYYRHTVYKTSPTWVNPGDGRGETPWMNCHGDKGQPGCTMNEQKRFAQIRAGGHLVDTYRHLHPVGSTPVASGREAWTWRGSVGGRYDGRGMRIDYTLVHESLVHRVRRSEILGHSRTREGFLGSDHCPILLELHPDEGGGSSGGGGGSSTSTNTSTSSKRSKTSNERNFAM